MTPKWHVNALKATLLCSVPANGRVDLCSVVLVWLGSGHDHDLALKKTKYVCYVQYLTWFNYINWLLYRPLYHLTPSLIFTTADKGLRLTLKGNMSNKLLAQWSYGRFSDEDRLDGLVTAGTLYYPSLSPSFSGLVEILLCIQRLPRCPHVVKFYYSYWQVTHRSTTADFQTVFTTSTKTDRNLGPKAALPPLRGAHSSPSMFL